MPTTRNGASFTFPPVLALSVWVFTAHTQSSRCAFVAPTSGALLMIAPAWLAALSVLVNFPADEVHREFIRFVFAILHIHMYTTLYTRFRCFHDTE